MLLNILLDAVQAANNGGYKAEVRRGYCGEERELGDW